MLAIVLAGAPAGADERLHTVVRDADGAVMPAEVTDVLRPAMRVYRDRDGLPQNSPMAIAFDHDGRLWVGTEDGVASFDGTRWTTVTLPGHEISTFIRAMRVDHDGALWIGRQDGGLLRRTPADGAWTTFDVAQGLPSPRVDDLLEVSGPDGTHVLWAATPEGLATFDGATWHAFAENAALPSSHVACLLDGTDDDGAPVVWVGTEAGVAMVKGGHVARLPNAPKTAAQALLQTQDRSGTRTLWVGSGDQPLARFSRGTWTMTGGPALPIPYVTALAVTTSPDGSQVVWVGTESGCVKLDHGRWVPLPSDALPSRAVRTFGVPPDAGPTPDLWIGLDTGLVRLHAGGWQSLDRTEGLPADSVYGTLVTKGIDGHDVLWIGTRSGGLSRFEAGRWHTFTSADGFHAQTVFGLAEHVEPDGTRSVYVGSLESGLQRWDGKTFTSVFPKGTVRQMFETTGDDGRPELWVTFAEGGLVVHAGDAWTHVNRASGAPFDFAFSTRVGKRTDGHRVVWVSTYGSGLAQLENGRWTSFTRSNSGLLSDGVEATVLTRRPDGHQELWLGTESGGAARLDLDAPGARWRPLTASTHPALPNDTVYHVEADAQGRVYAFTNAGVARISRRTPTPDDDADVAVETFTTEDGLPSNENNGGVAFVDDRGRLWAGTVGGAAMFDPSLEVREPEPTLLLAVHGDGGARRLLGGESLSHDEADVTLDATLVSLFRGAETRYRTQAVGAGASDPGSWRLDGRRELGGLAAIGTAKRVVVRAWAQDHRGSIRGPVEVAFEVRPAPWLTLWAFALYAAAAAAAVWGTVRWRVRTIEARNRDLESRIAERTRELGEKVDELAVSEKRAREAEDDARRANHAKTTFLSTMSHELRTPLNAILGFAQLLSRDRGLSRDSKESVDVVVKSGEHLLGLINDVLSITKIEAGKLAVDDATFDLSATVSAVDKMIRVRARSKRLTLQVDPPAGAPPFVRGDEGKVRQILLNLLGNAVKFTTEGGVAMRSSWKDGRAVFEVEDTGSGIAQAELGKLFEPFVQTDVGRKSREGTGLGLFISRSYAKLMGGDIEARSTLGHGTTFRVELALPAAERPPSPSEARRVIGLAPGQGPFKVLIVDDSADNRVVLARLLSTVGGFDVREAASGAEALRVFDEHRPDVTFMDLRMDDIDGIAATAAIRRREADEGWPRSTVLALSASAFDHDREWLMASGCDEFIAKPYREGAIFDALARHLRVRFVVEGGTSGAPSATLVTAERIAMLPAELLEALRTAARNGDLRSARAVVDRVARVDDELASGLREMVEGFRLEEIEAMLSEHG